MNVSNSGLRGWTRLGAAMALAMLALDAFAQTYSVDVHPTLNDLDVQIEPVASTGMLVLKLTNKTGQKVRCDLRYDASPQPPYRTTTYIEPKSPRAIHERTDKSRDDVAARHVDAGRRRVRCPRGAGQRREGGGWQVSRAVSYGH
jgi:hypothetical protein